MKNPNMARGYYIRNKKNYKISKLDGALIWMLYKHCDKTAEELAEVMNVDVGTIFRLVNRYERADTKELLQVLRRLTMLINFDERRLDVNEEM